MTTATVATSMSNINNEVRSRSNPQIITPAVKVMVLFVLLLYIQPIFVVKKIVFWCRVIVVVIKAGAQHTKLLPGY